jgi:hypothetical protein
MQPPSTLVSVCFLAALSLPVAALAQTTTPAAASPLTEIAWDSGGRFERTLDLPPGEFAELCGKLSKGQSVDWSFKSATPLDFNIHYHKGKQVVYPAKHGNTAGLAGKLKVSLDQEYCWMWENTNAAGATLIAKLRRR